MADRQEKLGIVVYVEDQASGKLTRVKAEVAGMGQAGSVAGAGLAKGASSIEKSGARISGALKHAKGAIGSLLTGPLGILGLGAGVFSLGTFLDGALHKASDFAVQIEKLTGLTGESAQSMGSLILLADRYGISEERLGMIVGFTEKTLGKLAQTTSKVSGATKSAELINLERIKNERVAAGLSTKKIDALIKEQKARDALNRTESRAVAGESKLVALDKQYGISLADNHGKAKNFSQVLAAVADYYNGTAAQSTKATLAATVFGRGYADLIPILRLGSKGIAEQEQAYKDLGLQLGTNTQDTLKAYQASIRQVGEAVNILQLQLGLALAPMVTRVADAISLFLEHGGAKQIVGVFEGAAHFAESLGQAVMTYVVPAFGLIQSAWNSIPEPLRTMLLAGQVGGKAFKFIFGIDLSPTALAGKLVGAVATGLLGKLSGSIFQRGSSPANPLYVTGTGIGSGGVGGLGILGALGTAGLIVGAADLLGNALMDFFGAKRVGDPGYDPRGTPIAGTPFRIGAAQPYYRDPRTGLPYGAEQPGGVGGPSYSGRAEDSTLAKPTLNTRGYVRDDTGAIAAVNANTHALSAAAQAFLSARTSLDDRLKHPVVGNYVTQWLKDASRIANSSESTADKIKDLEAIKSKLDAGDHHQAYYLQRMIAAEKARKPPIVKVSIGPTTIHVAPSGHVQAVIGRPHESVTYAGAGLAEGGIVRRRPGGRVFNIAEGAHDEAVIPLDDSRARARLGVGSGGGLSEAILEELRAIRSELRRPIGAIVTARQAEGASARQRAYGPTRARQLAYAG